MEAASPPRYYHAGQTYFCHDPYRSFHYPNDVNEICSAGKAVGHPSVIAPAVLGHTRTDSKGQGEEGVNGNSCRIHHSAGRYQKLYPKIEMAVRNRIRHHRRKSRRRKWMRWRRRGQRGPRHRGRCQRYNILRLVMGHLCLIKSTKATGGNNNFIFTAGSHIFHFKLPIDIFQNMPMLFGCRNWILFGLMIIKIVLWCDSLKALIIRIVFGTIHPHHTRHAETRKLNA
ncbi:2-C-methyl-D-erythritol 4-phosphatecytidylyltransferase [Striga asiatica]|uniref:2-C-methyl-D-erythritol 4-phosphatecytidylyltransferase n=1 Tax=Striga asiatica TaxID=4170 RepID=A0A5A7P1C8_STRAF|nr:2-C-methyl-D-erythritol 4-phosphatecytidylyltransferase [Striga asiatica]